MGFPQKLQKYRQAVKISQEELASRLGVSRQSVSKWEQGLSFPETEKLIELSNMMGVTIDSLLKDNADQPETPPPAEEEDEPEAPPLSSGEPEPPEPESPGAEDSGRKSWQTWLAIGLIVLLAAVALWQIRDKPTPTGDETIHQTESAPSTGTTAPTRAETEPTVTGPAETEPVQNEPTDTATEFANRDLENLQEWFFDFARDYRLDYMPQFTREEGPPTDSGEYLYWAYAINQEYWGEDKGSMTKNYVDETVLLHYAVIPGQHRSHRKSWDFDPDTETYTAYPGALKELPFYLLNSIEIDQGVYTVHATCYQPGFRVLSEEDDQRLRLALEEGVYTELTAVSEVTLTFQLDHVFSKPVFIAFTEEPLTDTAT